MKTYQGQERRCIQRRVIIDRRALVRWEPANPDRRQDHGRRRTDYHPQWL
ncbi:hypothetical protein PU634_01445 [Oceanimonas pelagia]|uniref:Uncharacterized protein n=1 Tax=Oceanimonas pelagia TaxID=3028314 RepID=A0AA50KPX5_9GAMM|nr:hypothetical protein [Oceanimonas pelagia]WMC11058.1 hypothetical protein PU634_01445 [Oceanimonas pelagia]